jgi:hypothetical protein
MLKIIIFIIGYIMNNFTIHITIIYINSLSLSVYDERAGQGLDTGGLGTTRTD